MTNGEWLNMICKMDKKEIEEFKIWCYQHNLLNRFNYYVKVKGNN